MNLSSLIISNMATTQLYLVLQVTMLMTLVMPLRPLTMTTALPVTSKPIENTAENLAWQAWLMLPPEQKQLMKSRKVTPKSIFTLPLRVECPEGHQQVDTKCLPTVIGSNAVLIDPNVLGLVLGDSPVEIDYDYEDDLAATATGGGGDGEEGKANMPVFNPPMYLSDSEKFNTDAVFDLKPPSKDEPLKFNIFQTKFPTDDYPLEDYSSISNEASAMTSQDTDDTNSPKDSYLPAAMNVTQHKDLKTEASNMSNIHSDFNLDNLEAISLPASHGQEHKQHRISLFNEDSALHLVTTVMDQAEGELTTQTQAAKENDLESLLQTESLMPMLNHTTVATTIPAESLTTMDEPKLGERLSLNIGDMEEMTTMLPNFTDEEQEPSGSMYQQEKVEHIRSVTMNPLSSEYNEDPNEVEATTTLTPAATMDNEPWQEEDSLETTTTMTSEIIQLDETTIIESNFNDALAIETTTPVSKISSGQATTQRPQVSKELSYKSATKQAMQDFEELQNMRKGQNDQNLAEPKKSKVEPVEKMSVPSMAEPIIKSSKKSNAVTTKPTTPMDELIIQETVTPLLTAHNNNNNDSDGSGNATTTSFSTNSSSNHTNDRFYYQHFAKQEDLESTQVISTTEAATAPPPPTEVAAFDSSEVETKSGNIQPEHSSTKPSSTMADIEPPMEFSVTPATSEIDLAEELRLINELVKGKQRPGQTASSLTTSDASDSDASTTSKTLSTSVTDANEDTNTPSPSPSLSTSKSSESLSSSMKFTLETTKIWSKIMPLIKTTTERSTKKVPSLLEEERSTTSTDSSLASNSNIMPSSSKLIASNRSHRNSKIIRINGFNSLENPDIKGSSFATTSPQPRTTIEDSSSLSSESLTTTDEDESLTISASSSTSSLPTTKDSDDVDQTAYEPFWWIPLAWRFDSPRITSSSSSTTTTTTTIRPSVNQDRSSEVEDMPLLLRFWSTYHAPKSS
ncbi:folded gastrulation [Haematobia irritans]|uniref:folded gastrulation n=1 Tax=Haematobia irritans TaxID=7368 RepID=UPI003F4F9C8E